MEYLIIFGYVIACSIIAQKIYPNDNAPGYWLGFFFGPFGIIIAAILSNNPLYIEEQKKINESLKIIANEREAARIKNEKYWELMANENREAEQQSRREMNDRMIAESKAEYDRELLIKEKEYNDKIRMEAEYKRIKDLEDNKKSGEVKSFEQLLKEQSEEIKPKST